MFISYGDGISTQIWLAQEPVLFKHVMSPPVYLHKPHCAGDQWRLAWAPAFLEAFLRTLLHRAFFLLRTVMLAGVSFGLPPIGPYAQSLKSHLSRYLACHPYLPFSPLTSGIRCRCMNFFWYYLAMSENTSRLEAVSVSDSDSYCYHPSSSPCWMLLLGQCEVVVVVFFLFPLLFDSLFYIHWVTMTLLPPSDMLAVEYGLS